MRLTSAIEDARAVTRQALENTRDEALQWPGREWLERALIARAEIHQRAGSDKAALADYQAAHQIFKRPALLTQIRTLQRR